MGLSEELMHTTLIPYTETATPLEAFVAYPTQERRPLVLLCHSWKGRDSFICDAAKQIASWGYVGFALDVYGKGVLGKTKEENSALKAPFLRNRALLQRRLLKGLEVASALPYVDSSSVAVLGFGFGGLCALDLARTTAALQGAISVYGHFDRPQNLHIGPIKAKVLILHGYNDPIVPPRDLVSLEEELVQTDWEVRLYGNTLHAFMNSEVNDPDAGLCYNATSAQKAWTAIYDFLAEVSRSSTAPV
jgi:dienelactone hydrolase